MSTRPLAPGLTSQESPDEALSRPAPIPPPDAYQIESLNELYLIAPPAARSGWLSLLLRPIWRVIVRVFYRQQNFNAAVVDHLNRNVIVGVEAHRATLRMIDWMQQSMLSAEDLRRHREALLAREQRANTTVASLVAAHEELRASVGVLQHATHSLKREIERLGEAGGVGQAGRAGEVGRADVAAKAASSPAPQAPPASAGLDSYKYVGFEDQFRGSQEDIRQRLTEYLPIFAGASDVLDIGCGRGEFLALLREQGVSARGVDSNRAMVEVCRERRLHATEGDALAYLQSLPDESLGGLLAAQVVEHLEPAYLSALLDAAFAKLRPGAPMVLETINPACWFAFFESYIRDLTHVRPIHPDTLHYLLVATGFQHVEIRYRAPYPEHDKLQPVLASDASLADVAETLNANVDKINRLLFTWLDYAAIGRRP